MPLVMAGHWFQMKRRAITKFQLVIFFHVSIADKPDYLVTSVFEWLIELWSGRAKKSLHPASSFIFCNLLEELRDALLGQDSQPKTSHCLGSLRVSTLAP